MNDKELEKFLSQFKTKIKPSEKLARKIVANLEIKEIIFNPIHNLMTKWKVIVPVVIVVLAILVWGIIQFGQKGLITGPEGGQLTGEEEEYIEKEYVKTPKEVSVPEITGDIDDVINAMSAFSENEMVIITDEGNDASLINLDSQAISDFGQSYDESEF